MCDRLTIQVVTYQLQLMVLVEEVTEKNAGEWISQAERQLKQGTKKGRKEEGDG